MNYLKEILAFTEKLAMDGLSPGQMSLWYALMAINNKCAWREWFSASNKVLELYSGLSLSAIRKNREVLKELGYIDFRFKGQNATEYKINSLLLFEAESNRGSNIDSNRDGNRDSNIDGNIDSNRDGNTLNKQNKKKQNKTNYYNTRKNKFNNYEDDNKTDYAALEEAILDSMLEETYENTSSITGYD